MESSLSAAILEDTSVAGKCAKELFSMYKRLSIDSITTVKVRCTRNTLVQKLGELYKEEGKDFYIYNGIDELDRKCLVVVLLT